MFFETPSAPNRSLGEVHRGPLDCRACRVSGRLRRREPSIRPASPVFKRNPHSRHQMHIALETLPRQWQHKKISRPTHQIIVDASIHVGS